MQIISDKTVPELLELHAGILEELRARNIIRTENAPTGDYAGYLFCKAFGWQQAGDSHKGYDALGANNTHYQIKGRRLVAYNSAPQLSAIRSLGSFDFLAAVLFDENYRVSRAAIIPVDVVQAEARPNAYSNSRTFYLQDFVWEEPGVEDVTESLRAVECSSPEMYVF